MKYKRCKIGYIMNFKTFIKAVGTGPKGNRDLSFDESFEAVSQILKQEPTQAQMGAFLIAWRVKLETNEEFKGAIKALDRKSTRLNSSHQIISYAVFCL